MQVVSMTMKFGRQTMRAPSGTVDAGRAS